MKTTVNFSAFVDAFRSMNRMDNFSYEDLEALFDYLEQYEQDSGEEMELDVIALCCDYDESDVMTITQDYQIDLSEADQAIDEETKQDIILETVCEYLNDNTIVAGVLDNGNIVYANF
jgi:hypothetical protein